MCSYMQRKQRENAWSFSPCFYQSSIPGLSSTPWPWRCNRLIVYQVPCAGVWRSKLAKQAHRWGSKVPIGCWDSGGHALCPDVVSDTATDRSKVRAYWLLTQFNDRLLSQRDTAMEPVGKKHSPSPVIVATTMFISCRCCYNEKAIQRTPIWWAFHLDAFIFFYLSRSAITLRKKGRRNGLPLQHLGHTVEQAGSPCPLCVPPE